MEIPTEKTKLLEADGASKQNLTSYTYLGSQFSTRFGDSFFDVNITKVFLDSNYCCNRHGIYEVSVRQGKNSWIVEKRFRDFFSLYKEYPSVAYADFPQKTYFPSLDPGFLEDRQEKLQAFMVHLITTLSETGGIKFGTPIARFLELKA